ncbi:MarR family transcriptional regulator [Pseudomaricurvus alkylphenolicus]|uniref:MarR family transcriptional regulator n=1 Tax=Pseudomaricurvus alkylphenolicus TaxID=1306991 RepID=UPI00141DF053|nr:MarR family transcriptional regulator [Pseudomaricurvus alkylphenolicus]
MTLPTAAKVRYPMDLQSFLPYRFFRMALRMSDTGSKLSTLLKESEANIGEREWRVMGVLGAYGGLTNTQVAEVTGMDAATITRAVKTLKTLEFVETRSSKRDRRKTLVLLTQAGADFHDSITPQRISTGESIDACFAPEEKETLLRLMNKLDRHLETLANQYDDEWE